MSNVKFPIGSKVRLTAKFLRNTGQYTGSAPQSVWTVTGYSAENPDWVITDEPSYHPPGYYSDAELAEDPTLRFRRINAGNLQSVKTRDPH